MAGSGHRSATGLDDRTLGRIDLILYDADYPDAAAALDDAWRVAVLASDARTRADHDRVRAAAVRAANEYRDPIAAKARTSTGLHRTILGAAYVLGTVAVALVATPRNSPLTLQDGMLPAGLLAVISVSLQWWLEPRRANGSLWGSRAPAVIPLILGALWLLAAGGALVFRWGELDPNQPLPATTGVTMLACAGVAALALAWRAFQADRSGRQTGVARLAGDLLDPRDEAEVFETLDRWWSHAGAEALRRDAPRVRTVRVEVLARLRLGMLITERDERAASAAPQPGSWRERRR